MVRIYEAGSVFEASLIRRTLAAEGIDCLIPGEELDAPVPTQAGENAIFVPESERDRALGLLERAWSFYGTEDEDGREDQ
jgi:hypothetical protein